MIKGDAESNPDILKQNIWLNSLLIDKEIIEGNDKVKEILENSVERTKNLKKKLKENKKFERNNKKIKKLKKIKEIKNKINI